MMFGCDGDTHVKEPSKAYLHITNEQKDLATLLRNARRIPNSSGWFEIIKLPNNVYVFWEPGHKEKVNSFLILGKDKDILYDTGMGIASIGKAVQELRQIENFAEHEIMVINSHNHLDHNGSNTDFDQAWIYNNDWAIEKLTHGIPSGNPGFIYYWNQLTPYDGIQRPADFEPETFSIPPFALENIRFLADGDIIDLGDKKFEVIHTVSHSPDGIALYDRHNQILFGGDTLKGTHYLIMDINLLENDLEKASRLDVKWHYSSHGPQLIEVMQSGVHLAIIKRMISGERNETQTKFAGQPMPLYELDGVTVALAGELLTYLSIE
jgi:glyoxylase-like metal-dependent hydrolase (beta-lactamase superfamily II)